MKFKEITLVSEATGKSKVAPMGFSWTTLFFGCFPALFRGNWKWALIMFLSAIITFGVSWLVYPFIYNKMYVKDLLKDGYTPVDVLQCNYLFEKGLINDIQRNFILKNMEGKLQY